MEIKSTEKVTKVDMRFVDKEKDKAKPDFEIFKDGEWTSVTIREIKKDQIFRSHGELCKACSDASFEEKYGGFGVVYEPVGR